MFWATLRMFCLGVYVVLRVDGELERKTKSFNGFVKCLKKIFDLFWDKDIFSCFFFDDKAKRTKFFLDFCRLFSCFQIKKILLTQNHFPTSKTVSVMLNWRHRRNNKEFFMFVLFIIKKRILTFCYERRWIFCLV